VYWGDGSVGDGDGMGGVVFSLNGSKGVWGLYDGFMGVGTVQGAVKAGSRTRAGGRVEGVMLNAAWGVGGEVKVLRRGRRVGWWWLLLGGLGVEGELGEDFDSRVMWWEEGGRMVC